MAKMCITCSKTKLLTDFTKNKRRKDGYQSYCRKCSSDKNKAYYKTNRTDRQQKIRARDARVFADNCQRLWLFLKVHPCVACGEADPLVLEFDHRGDKVKTVSAMVIEGLRWATVETEIAKCDVRCANCHRRKTVLERNHWKARFHREDSHAATMDS